MPRQPRVLPRGFGSCSTDGSSGTIGEVRSLAAQATAGLQPGEDLGIGVILESHLHRSLVGRLAIDHVDAREVFGALCELDVNRTIRPFQPSPRRSRNWSASRWVGDAASA